MERSPSPLDNAPLMHSRNSFRTIFALLAIAFALRVGVAVWWQERLEARGERFAMGDSESYWHLAHTLARNEPYQYGSPDAAVFRTPLYPWLLSWVVDAQPHQPNRPQDESYRILLARLLGCVFGTLAVAILMTITAAYFGLPTSIIAGCLATIYPGGIISSVLVLSEAPFLPIMMLVLAALAFCERAIQHLPSTISSAGTVNGNEPGLRGSSISSSRQISLCALAAGILSGLAVLIRPSWLLFLPAYFGWQWIRGPRRATYFATATVAGLAVSMVMMPWWIRNYQITGHFVLTTLQVGASLYDGLHPRATGGSDTGMDFVLEQGRALRLEDAAQPVTPQGFEYRLNQRLSSAAITWAKENPGRTLQLAGLKIARTWWPWPAATELPGGWPTRIGFAMSTLMILVPGLIYSVRHRSWREAHFPYLFPLIYFTLLHAIFVGSIRYREPALFAFTVLAAPQYWDWYKSWRLAVCRHRSQESDLIATRPPAVDG